MEYLLLMPVSTIPIGWDLEGRTEAAECAGDRIKPDHSSWALYGRGKAY